MDQLELAVEKREILGKQVKYLRREGLIPAVVFGHAIGSIPLQIPEKALRMVLARAGSNRLIALQIEGEKEPTLALAREVQRDVLKGTFQHVDFQAVVMTEKIRTHVGLNLSGDSPALEMDTSAMLLQSLDSIEIECLPGDLISTIDVDVSKLEEIDAAIYVKDLEVPSTVAIITHPEEMIVRVSRVMEVVEEAEEEELLEEEEMEAGEVEVIRRGKAEGEEEGEAEE